MSTSKRTKGHDYGSESESSSPSSSSSSSSSSDAGPTPKPKQTYRPFQLSQIRASSSAQPSASSTSKHDTSTVHQPSDMSTKLNIPLILHGIPILELASSNKAKDTIDSDDDTSSSLPESPVFSTRQKPDNHPMESSDDDPKPPRTAVGRTKAQLERDMNTIRSEFEGYQARADERLDRIEDRQTRFEKQQALALEKLDTLINQTREAPAPKGPTTEDEKPAIASLFVTASSIQSRRYRDKAVEKIPSEHKAQAVAFTRMVAKAGLGGVRKLTSNVPGFYYQHGQPDYFPDEFTGDDGYCKPYPHWNKSFADNHHWFSVFITLWRSMVPEDGSEFTVACRKFTDRQILVLLHDGPFKSLAAGWNRENTAEHTEGSEVEKNAKKRGAARLESKALTRLKYRPEIIHVAGPGWDATWSKPVMSPELTDSEGGKLIKRSRWRAAWSNDMYEAINNAERGNELAKPGVHRPLARHTIELVNDPPPPIYLGKGKNKTLVKLPLAMISKRWRKTLEGKAWMKVSAHLIDEDLKHKPDISAFLKAHPPLKASMTEGKEEPEGEEAVVYEGGDEDEDNGKGAEPMVTNVSTRDEIEIDPGLESPSQVPVKACRPRPQVVKTTASPVDTPTIQANSVAPTPPLMSQVPLPLPYFPQQPQYPIPASGWDGAAQVSHQHPPNVVPTVPGALWQSHHISGAPVAVTPYESNGHTLHLGSSTQQLPQPCWPMPMPMQMPPPPTLSQQNTPAPEPTKKKRKKRTKVKEVEQDAPGPSSTADILNSSEEPPTKRGPGRPRGSKNKKTLEKERLVVEANRKV